MTKTQTVFQACFARVALGTAAIGVALLVGAGCSAPETPVTAVDQQQKSSDSSIQAIQNNPNMPAAAKEQAIAGIKAQQSRVAPKP